MSTKKVTVSKKLPVPQNVISGLELVALETSRESLRLLSQQVREAVQKLAGLEQDIIKRLKAGARVEGDMVAIIKLQGGGTISPSWKTHYLDHMVKEHGISADTAEQNVRRLTTPSSPTEVLVVGPKENA
jgi:hypothetical protein